VTHPSGRPLRPSVVKKVRQPVGTFTGFVTARLNQNMDQLAGGCGFPIMRADEQVMGAWVKR
jgi:hypothetical protein